MCVSDCVIMRARASVTRSAEMILSDAVNYNRFVPVVVVVVCFRFLV